jgi:hypothetical protein
MANVFTSIAVSPSGTTLLNALQVTTTAGNVLNEAVTLADANNGNNVGSVLASGAQLIEPGGANVQPVSGTVTANQATAANLNATVVGTVTANAGTGTLAVNLVQVAGAVPSATNPEFVRLTDGTTAITAAVSAWGVAPTGTQVQGVNNNLFIAGTLAVAGATGVQKVAISGNAGGQLDGSAGAATPARILQVGGAYVSTAPAPSTGQLEPFQLDSAGQLFVNHIRRSSLAAKATTIASSSAATTVVTAPGASIFADLVQLIITCTGTATNTAFTATLSDGTNSFVFDMNTGGTTTFTQGTVIDILFDPPLPATTAATAWTIQLSSAAVTVHITTNAILQKAA